MITRPRHHDLCVAVVSDYSLAHLGGAENAYADQVRALSGVADVLAVSPPSGRLERLGEHDGVTTFPISAALTLPGLGLPVIRNTERLRARLRQAFNVRNVDVVHSEFGLAAAAIAVAKELGIPTVETVHTFFWQTRAPVQTLLAHAVPRFHRAVTGLEPTADILAERRGDSALRNMTLTLARRVDRVISPSAHQAVRLRWAGLPKVDVVPNSAPANPAAEPLTRVAGPLRVLWIGRFTPEKRVVAFVEAALKALDAVGPDNLRVDMVGTGPQFCQVARMVDERPGIHLAGALPNHLIPARLRRNHVTVLSSIGWDNQPMTVAESVTALRGVIWCDPALAEGLVATKGLPGAGMPAFEDQGPGKPISGQPGIDLASILAGLALSPGPVIEASRRAMSARDLFTAGHFTSSVLDVYRRAGVRDCTDIRSCADAPITSPTELENAS
ncbi:glycosyltransferase family 4 protein [Propionimicrobium sp. PCR01-08-3]|uniref:glycosyltransferase family 4 protein n=1 Tax=Propionimicrobium sp. PCR01-08-3 TaxID=3052086 RepID=UPI00255C2B1F|nr:glycosyltransferase family 4 protein [Propionimicrobium sp. PCR01-08-3]WIY83538.1 glycosyltransferase family 4 protein [Propionimicrobium sp. PCR01-08-3]